MPGFAWTETGVITIVIVMLPLDIDCVRIIDARLFINFHVTWDSKLLISCIPYIMALLWSEYPTITASWALGSIFFHFNSRITYHKFDSKLSYVCHVGIFSIPDMVGSIIGIQCTRGDPISDIYSCGNGFPLEPFLEDFRMYHRVHKVKKYAVHAFSHHILLRGTCQSVLVLDSIFNQLLHGIIGKILSEIIREKHFGIGLIGKWIRLTTTMLVSVKIFEQTVSVGLSIVLVMFKAVKCLWLVGHITLDSTVVVVSNERDSIFWASKDSTSSGAMISEWTKSSMWLAREWIFERIAVWCHFEILFKGTRSAAGKTSCVEGSLSWTGSAGLFLKSSRVWLTVSYI